jgi:hypothetical protein
MSQPMYNNAAEKQKAYRDRLRAQGLVMAPTRPRAPKLPSRPARLAAIEAALRELATEYGDWLAALPTNLAESQLAEQLTAITEGLDTIANEVGELEPPRIGRASHAR